MRYWLVKGNPTRNDLDEMLVPGQEERWVTRKPPRDWAPGDFVFFWKSSPARCLAGFGTLRETHNKNEEGDAYFIVGYESAPFATKIGIESLRGEAILSDASFLKAGAAGTVFPIAEDQARRLAALTLAANHSTLAPAERRRLASLANRGSPTPADETLSPGDAPLKALIIRAPFVDWILDGKKTWEMRSRSTKVRGRIALIEGGSGTVVGNCELVDAIGPLNVDALRANASKLNARPENIADDFGYEYAWVVRGARRLVAPVPYEHPSGAVIWVNLTRDVARRVLAGLAHP